VCSFLLVRPSPGNSQIFRRSNFIYRAGERGRERLDPLAGILISSSDPSAFFLSIPFSSPFFTFSHPFLLLSSSFRLPFLHLFLPFPTPDFTSSLFPLICLSLSLQPHFSRLSTFLHPLTTLPLFALFNFLFLILDFRLRFLICL
jgi:hypothetical protein